jgi:serine protease Do
MENEERKVPISEGKRPKWKSFLSILSAGVIGSALTLTIAPQLDAWESTNMTNHQGEEVINKDNSSVEVQQVSNSEHTSIADIVENASEAIVGVVNISKQSNPFNQDTIRQKNGTGSGVIYRVTDEELYIITNHHVIDGASEIEVSLFNGDVVEAELVGTDALTDIAVLKVKGKYDIKPITIGDSDELRAGDTVLAIGNPLGLDLSRTVTQGIVSGVNRTISTSTASGEWDVEVIQTDAAINPGNSGGALINTKGELVGINSMKIAEDGVEGLGFAIPSNNVMDIVDELMEHGQVQRPYIGVGLASFDEIHPYYLNLLNTNISEGAIVLSVDEQSAAGKAGLQEGDIIVSINGEKIDSANSLRKYLYTELSIGDKVTLEFYRNNQLQSVDIVLTGKEL